MVTEDKGIDKFIQDIKSLSDMLEARGNSGPAHFFSDAAKTLTGIPVNQWEWIACLKNICRCVPISSYGGFNETETHLLYDIIEQGFSISKRLEIDFH
ncbi:hypothetical protein [Nostoc sp.]